MNSTRNLALIFCHIRTREGGPAMALFLDRLTGTELTLENMNIIYYNSKTQKICMEL